MTARPSLARVAFLGDYVPRQCGIATFTRDVCEAVAAAAPEAECYVGAVNDRVEGYNHARFFHQNTAWSAAVRCLADAIVATGAALRDGGSEGDGQIEMQRGLELADSAALHAAVAHYVEATLPVVLRPFAFDSPPSSVASASIEDERRS